MVGDRKDKGNAFGTNLISVSDSLPDLNNMVREPLRNICILKGGIDAVKVEHPELLTKSSSQQTEQSILDQFARYVKKHSNSGPVKKDPSYAVWFMLSCQFKYLSYSQNQV